LAFALKTGRLPDFLQGDKEESLVVDDGPGSAGHWNQTAPVLPAQPGAASGAFKAEPSQDGRHCWTRFY